MSEVQILWEDSLEAPIRPYIRIIQMGETLCFEIKEGDQWHPTNLSEQDMNILIRRLLSANRSWERLATSFKETNGPLLCDQCSAPKSADAWYCCQKALQDAKPSRSLTDLL